MSDQPQSRIIRVLEYTGDPDWLTMCMISREIKEEHRFGGGPNVIREGILGRSTAMVEPDLPYQGTFGSYETLMSVFQDTGYRMRNTKAGGIGGEYSAGQSADALLEVIEAAGFRLVRR